MGYRRIIGLGLCVLDHLYVVERLGSADTRLRYSERRVSSGGMMGTALAQAAELGCNAQLLSLVGDDEAGRFIRRSLRARGVKTGRLLLSAELPTTVAVILVERRSGQRRFLVPDRRSIERRAPRFDLASMGRGTILMLDGHFPAQALRAAKRAREVGATVMGDFSRPKASVRALLPFVDYPVVPLEFVQEYGAGDSRKTLRQLAERYGGTPVVTQGARGGVYLSGGRSGRVRRFHAPRVEVRDTTGAGDAFHGALAAGLSLDRALPDALELAARAGALNCTALGGMARLMTRDEMLAG